MLACLLAAVLLTVPCPVFASDGDALRTASPHLGFNRISAQDYAAADLLVNGTYYFDSFTSSTGMVDPNGADSPAMAVVRGDEVKLVLDIYNPLKYDGLWFGRRSDAPQDPYDESVVSASFIPAGDYSSDELWTDSGGIVGEAGQTYKAARFVMSLAKDDFRSILADNGTMYFAIRRAPWSPSNPGKWMGSNDNYFTLSGLRYDGESTLLPGEKPYGDGVYRFESFACDTGMVTPVPQDGPAMAVIRGDEVTLTIDVYNPDKYDGLWLGKRADAPIDPFGSETIGATMVPVGDYSSGATNKWADEEGLVGEAGAVYKAARFEVPMAKDAFIAMVENGVDDDLYFVIRRAPWSPSNPGKWMGSSDHYFTFGTLEWVADLEDPTGDDKGADAKDDLARAKSLIDALPYDPYKVQLSDADAIEAAESAFAGLSKYAQEQLKIQDAANGVLTYGRTLECALWGLRALAPVDDTTILQDGSYTTQVTSTCEMGQSNSPRQYKFTVVKVVVREGHAAATLEHDTASPDTVSIGATLYRHVNEDEKAHSRFEVPIDLNSTFYLSQMAKNPTANTIAIPYEMTTTIDEANAVPDSPEAEVPTASARATDKKNAISNTQNKRRVKADMDPKVIALRRPHAAVSAPEEDVPIVQEIARKTRQRNAPEAAGDRLVETSAAAAPFAAAGASALVMGGVIAFTIDYFRRERRPVHVRGVRLSGKRA